jgi:hypothetical protein
VPFFTALPVLLAAFLVSVPAFLASWLAVCAEETIGDITTARAREGMSDDTARKIFISD